jgi:hypothetical protein
MTTPALAEILQPEDAEIHIDPQNGRTPVCGTVYKEVRGDMPVAVAQEVIDEEMPAGQTGQEVATVPVQEHLNEQASSTQEKRPSGRGCFYLEGLLGMILTFAAVLVTFVIELSAAIVYCVAAGFHWVANIGEQMPGCIKTILLLVVQLLMIADAVLLATSLMATEILGGVTSLVTSMFSTSCCLTGKAWQVYVRKVCHSTRWAFRDLHDGWMLERSFPVDLGEERGTITTIPKEPINNESAVPPAAVPQQQVLVDHESGQPQGD